MRILYLSPRQSWPPVTGAKLRDYHLARALGVRSELTYAFYSQPGSTVPTLQDLPFCRRIIPIPAPRPYSPWKLVQGVIGPWPVTVVNYTSAEMIRSIGNLLRQESFDLVHVDIIHLAACEAGIRKDLGSTPVFYNWHNIESELMQRYGEQAPSFARRRYAALTARSLQSIEDRILRTASGHVVCSDRERALLLQRNSQARVAVIENGVDTAAFQMASPAESDAEPRRRLVFVGSMNYHANIEGALWFTRSIWPGILKRFPAWKLTIVGANPVPAVLALRTEPGVEVTGTVPDVKPYYRDAFAAVVPVRSGSGTRLKILEAMAAGVPVISTPIGAEGLPLSPGKDILLAEQEQEWQAALEELQSPDRWIEIAVAAKAYVVRHDWQVLGRRLYDTYCEWMGRTS